MMNLPESSKSVNQICHKHKKLILHHHHHYHLHENLLHPLTRQCNSYTIIKSNHLANQIQNYSHHHLHHHNHHQQQHHHHHQQQQHSKHNQLRPKMLSLISIIISYLVLISIAPTHEAKPLNSNQIRFRRLPPKEFSAALGSSITIECEAGGSPPPTIHWLKNGKRVLQNDFDENQLEDGQAGAGIQGDDVNRIALSATRSRLFIDCADLSDEATYTCVAENSFSRISSHTKLNLIKPIIQQQLPVGNENDLINGGTLEEVAALELAAAATNGNFKQMDDSKAASAGGLSAIPQCLSQRGARSTEPVRIHMWTHNIVEVMKNNVILYCRSNARRQPVIGSDATASNNGDQRKQLDDQQDVDTDKRMFVSWTLADDKLVSIDQKDKYEILETGDLLIKDLRWADMGSYVCTVSDDQGSDSVSSFVYPASVKANNVNNANNDNNNSKRSAPASTTSSSSSSSSSSTTTAATSLASQMRNRLASIFDR